MQFSCSAVTDVNTGGRKRNTQYLHPHGYAISGANYPHLCSLAGNYVNSGAQTGENGAGVRAAFRPSSKAPGPTGAAKYAVSRRRRKIARIVLTIILI